MLRTFVLEHYHGGSHRLSEWYRDQPVEEVDNELALMRTARVLAETVLGISERWQPLDQPDKSQ
jgi:hypothetical protein